MRDILLAPMGNSVHRVVLVGRPNVGKSALFNRIIGKRKALVHNEPGVTRDRLHAQASWSGTDFELIDTGGLAPGDEDRIRAHIAEQVGVALQEASVVIFLVDGREGLNPLDEDIARYLRGRSDRVLLAVNKVDDSSREMACLEFFALGYGEGVWVSAEHGLNIHALLDAVVLQLDEGETPVPQVEGKLKVAFVGRPNVGKSSLLNCLTEEERVLVDDAPGTTRDPVTAHLTTPQGGLLLVDTAGLKRKSKLETRVEQVSDVMARRALTEAHIGVLVLDSQDGISRQDQRIAGLIQKSGRSCVVAINKWDLVSGVPEKLKWWERVLDNRLYFLRHAPRVYLSALTGQGIAGLLEALDVVAQATRYHLPTHTLNRLVREAELVHAGPARGGRRLRTLYAAQLRNRPATFVLKVNDPTLVHFSYSRHLENVLREAGGFPGVPITLLFRKGRKGRQ